MIIYQKFLVEQLNTILPTYNELFLDSSTTTPCISILQSNNTRDAEGDLTRFSRIYYTIKIWSRDLSEIATYSQQLDDLMFSLQFEREGYQELWFDGLCSAIFTYSLLADENYVKEN